jgi:hypothetical protein
MAPPEADKPRHSVAVLFDCDLDTSRRKSFRTRNT